MQVGAAGSPEVLECVICLSAPRHTEAVIAWPECGHISHVQCMVRYLRRLPEEPFPEQRGPVQSAAWHLQDHLLPSADWLALCACPMRGAITCGLGVEACMQRWGDPSRPDSAARRALEELEASARRAGITVGSLEVAEADATAEAAAHRAGATAMDLRHEPEPEPPGVVGGCCDGHVAHWVSSCPPVRGPNGVLSPGPPRSSWVCQICLTECMASDVPPRPSAADMICRHCGRMLLWAFRVRRPRRPWWHCERCGPAMQVISLPAAARPGRIWRDQGPPEAPIVSQDNSEFYVPLLLHAAGLLRPAAQAQWERHPVAGAWWPAAVAPLAHPPPVDPWRLHAMGMQFIEARVNEGRPPHVAEMLAWERFVEDAQALQLGERVFFAMGSGAFGGCRVVVPPRYGPGSASCGVRRQRARQPSRAVG